MFTPSHPSLPVTRLDSQGITVQDFSIGFGPKILSYEDKEGINYSLRLLPLGASWQPAVGFTRPAGRATRGLPSSTLPFQPRAGPSPPSDDINAILFAGGYVSFPEALTEEDKAEWSEEERKSMEERVASGEVRAPLQTFVASVRSSPATNFCMSRYVAVDSVSELRCWIIAALVSPRNAAHCP